MATLQELGINHEIPIDVVFYKPPYNQVRRAKIIVFISCLMEYQKYKEYSYDNKMKLIKQLERACYNYVIDKSYENNITASWTNNIFCDLYHSICYKISANLESKGLVINTTLVNNLLSGTISVEDLPKLSSIELYPQKYTKIIEKVEASKQVEQSLKSSAMYRCSKCKQNKCTLENRYNRSLDECVNLTVTCVNCGHSWCA